VTALERALIRIDSDLRQIDVAFALIGGLAVSLRAEPRTTRDVDLAVAIDDDDAAEAVIRGLLGLGYRVLQQLELGPIAASRAGRRRFDPGRPLFPESPVPRGFRRLQALGCLGARGEGSGRVPALDAFRSDLGGRLRGPRRFSEGIELGGVHPGVAVPGLDHREGGSDYFAGTGRREPSAECPITLTL